jgi:hypothetical protein
MRQFLFAVYIIALLIACARGDDSHVTQAGVAKRDTLVIDGAKPQCATCRIEVGAPVLLGRPTDEHIPRRAPKQILRDSRGHSYLTFHGWSDKQILRYDSVGRLLGRIGRNGEGPGEYRMTSTAYIGPGDSLYVYAERRVIVYDPDGKFARTFRIGSGLFGGQPIGTTRAGTTLFLPRSFGEEHPDIVSRVDSSGAFLDSFPIFSPKIGFVTEWRSGATTWKGEQRVNIRPVLGQDGTIWTMTELGERLERHRADGVPDMVIGIQRDSMPRPILTEIEAESLAAIRRSGPRPRQAFPEEAKRFRHRPRTTASVAVDSVGLIWIVRTVPAPAYDTIQLQQVDMSKTEAPGEFVIPREVEDRRSFTVVEILDPREHKLLARTTLPFLGMLAAPGYIGRVTQDEDGFYLSSVYPLRLRR